MPRIEYGYGFFPGGDPRKFSPDLESSTPEELESHRRACEAWNSGEQESSPDCIHSPGVIVTRCQFGLGSYEYEEEDPPYDLLLCYRKRLPRRRKKVAKKAGVDTFRMYWLDSDPLDAEFA